MPDSSAAVVEVFAVALHAASRLNAAPGGSCVVLGLGPVGIAATQVLRSAGVHRTVGIDNSAFRRQMAGSLGAQQVAGFDGMPDAARSVAGPGPGGRGAGCGSSFVVQHVVTALGRPTGSCRALQGSDRPRHERVGGQGARVGRLLRKRQGIRYGPRTRLAEHGRCADDDHRHLPARFDCRGVCRSSRSPITTRRYRSNREGHPFSTANPVFNPREDNDSR